MRHGRALMLSHLLVLAAVIAHASPAQAQADLVLSNFYAAVNGTTVTYHATVCNVANTSVSASFDLALYYNRGSSPGCNATPSQVVTIAGLAAGNCTVRSFTRTNTPSGSYKAWAFADASCSVTETSEGNNAASYPYNVLLPDLTVSNFFASPVGSTVTFYATICNQGAGTTAPFALEIYYNRTSEPGCGTAHSQVVTVQGLGQAMCAIYSFTRNATPTGSYTGWARVDADCAVNEMDETNNNASSAYSVGLPNLVLSNLSAAVTGGTVTYHATICNQGESTTTPFELELYYDRPTAPGCGTAHSQFVTVNGLPSGNCTIRTFNRTGTPVGSYTAWAFADAGCVVTESSEGDNQASYTYVVGQPDLALTNFSASVSYTTVTFDVTICNFGEGTTASFALELYYDLATAPGCTTTHSHVVTVAGLATAECSTHQLYRNNTPLGSYTGWARVDADCAVAEGSESNNNASDTYHVTSLPPDAGVPDAFVQLDAGVPDAAAPDTTASVDTAQPPDAPIGVDAPPAGDTGTSTDTATSIDTASSMDSATEAEAGEVVDGQVKLDAGPTVDTGVAKDEGLTDVGGTADAGLDTSSGADGAGGDVSPTWDLAPGPDLGADGEPSASGCDCQVSGQEARAMVLPLFFVLGLLGWSRRRRRR